MSRGRRSLRDRDEFAISHEPDQPQQPDPVPEPPQEQSAPAPAPEAPAEQEVTKGEASPSAPPAAASSRSPRRAARAPRSAPQARGSGTTQRIGIYFRTAEAFDAAKAAYLADWSSLPDSADTFARWIAGAVEQHSRRTPTERGEVAQATFHVDEHEGQGLTRSFSLPEASVAAMKSAIAEDRAAGRWGSMSEFCGEAIAAAVADARERAGGTLPAAPARLPNRLVR